MTCARTGTSLRCELFGSPHAKPFTATAEGATKLHYVDYKLCIETAKAELRCAALGAPLGAFETITWAPRRQPKTDP